MMIRVDAIPEKEFTRDSWIGSVRSRRWYSGLWPPEKLFPARATLKNLDPRLRPGNERTAEIIVERQPNVLLIPARASFLQNGKPAVYIQKGQQFLMRKIEVGRRNDEDMVVPAGLKEGELVTLEKPGGRGQTRQEKAVSGLQEAHDRRSRSVHRCS